MNFAELQKAIAEQTELAKSLSAAQVDAKGNATVAADAASGAAAGGAGGASEEEEDDGNGNGDLGSGSPMIKSFKLVLEDGTEMEAQDATEMVKCLVDEINKVKGTHAAHVEEMAKSFEGAVGLITTLTEGLKATRQDVLQLAASNSLMAKSLEKVGTQGRGKRSVDVVLGDRPNLNGNGAGAGKGGEPSKQEILAKAEGALNAGRITGTEATKVMTALNMNVMPEKAILDRIFN